MKLLLEENSRVELDRIRLLMESNGIPVIVGNENAARNFGFVVLAQPYGLWVLEDEQYPCALALLENEDYKVEHPIDVKEYYNSFSEEAPNVYDFMWKRVLLPGVGITVIFFIAMYLILS